MIFESKQFVNKIRRTYLPEKPHNEIPQQHDLGKGIDPIVKLKEAARILDCDLDHFTRAPRIWGTLFSRLTYRMFAFELSVYNCNYLIRDKGCDNVGFKTT